MTNWLFIGGVILSGIVLQIFLFRVAFGAGDRKREREELRRSAKRAEPERE